jgi:lipid A ethanolaminephosphotransferase
MILYQDFSDILVLINFQGYSIKRLTQNRLILLVSAIFVIFYNYTFFFNVLKIYPLNSENIAFLISIAILLLIVTAFVFTVFASRWTTKPMLILSLVISSMTAYFMNAYNVVIDHTMIQNTMQTDTNEAMDLLSFKQVVYFIFLGLLPSYLVYKAPVNYRTFKVEALSKLKYILVFITIMAALILSFYKHYSSFAREHKPLRYNANPMYWVYSLGFYINNKLTAGPIIVEPIGLDAKVVKEPNELPKVVVLVVGEATRADHFSFNGYGRETTPNLKQEDILNFSNVRSCGTSTAISVSCMFSIYTRENYSYKKAIRTENILDVLQRTGEISVLWRENNSGSKGVALRVPFEYFKSPIINSICTKDECRDEGMVLGLDKYIHNLNGKDALVVLHQMGNHGPAYYKRYPKEFEKYTPVCKTNQLEECSQEEISNAYDNAILYTDHVLSQTIKVLKTFEKTHNTAMIYMSDHGESLGENGIYLHGLPYFMAPDEQTHIPAFVWLDEGFKKELDLEKLDTTKRYTHDNLFHTLLGLFNVETEVYDPALDIFKTD